MPRDVEDVAVALGRDQADGRAVVLDHDVRRDRRAVEDLVERRRRLARLLGQLPDPLHRPLGRVVGRRRQLVDEDRPRVVVDVDQVGERAADVDAEPLHRPPPGLEDDLAEVLAALHRLHRVARLLEREGLVDERRDQPARGEIEHLLDLVAVVDERADDLLLRPEERDDVEGHDLARVAAADHEPAVLRERVEADLEELAADVLVHDVDAAAVGRSHDLGDDVLRLGG